MNIKERERIDELCVKKLNELYCDKLDKLQYCFSTEKKFAEYYESNLSFSQIFCKINLPGLINTNIKSNVSTEEAKEFNLLAQEINKKLIDIQKEIALQELSEYQIKDYFYFSRVTENLGICKLSIYSRNKEEEELEQKEEEASFWKELQENTSLKKDYDWHNEENRPYGGAFESLEDYYTHIS